MAKWIAGLLPPHRTYVEPFCGSAAVLFAKQRAKIECITDLDKDVIAMMLAIRDMPSEFTSELEVLEYDQGTFERWRNMPAESLDFFNAAIRQFVVSNMSRGGLGETFAWSDRLRGGRPGDLNAWLTKLELIPKLAERLKRVWIFNVSAFETIEEHQRIDRETLIYADPPYLHETRTAKDAYAHELTRDQHVRLLDLLDAHAGPVALSGYPSPLYDERLKGWARHVREMPNHSGQGKAKQRRTEVLWIKPARPMEAGR